MKEQNSDYESSETNESGYDSDNNKCFCKYAESVDYKKYQSPKLSYYQYNFFSGKQPKKPFKIS